jgi:hypothetical protein
MVQVALSAPSTDTTAPIITIPLSGAPSFFYVVPTTIVIFEFFSTPMPAAATAHAFKFGQVTSSTGQVWMDRKYAEN